MRKAISCGLLCMLVWTHGALGAAEPSPAELAEQLRAELEKAPPERYLLLLSACRDRALNLAQQEGIKAEQNPFHQLLAASVAAGGAAELRVAVVRSVTSWVPGGKPYFDGFRMLLPYLGGEPEPFRHALRDGLAGALGRAPAEFSPLVEELRARLAGVDASRTEVEDAAYVLWAYSPAQTIETLVNGLAAREAGGGDAAAYHWVLWEFTRQRMETAEAWSKNLAAVNVPAVLQETHAVRARVTQELMSLWNDSIEALRMTAAGDTGFDAYWRFVRKALALDTACPRAALRVRACRELAAIVAGKTAGAVDAKTRDLLAQDLGLVLELMGAGPRVRFEPLEVRIEALRVLQALRDVGTADPRVPALLEQIIAGDRSERPLRVKTVRVGGELRVARLREPVCGLILREAAEGGVGAELLRESVVAVGKIGLEAPGGNTTVPDQVLRALMVLYDREFARGGAAADRFCEAAVWTLGKIGARGSITDDVKAFVRRVLASTQDKRPGLAVFAINALGDLRDIDALRSDLAAVFARRPAVAPNVVEAAVNVVWLIGNSEQVGALDAAVALLAEYIEAGDAAFSQLVTDKVLFLSRRSIGSAATVAGALAARQRWRSAERILGHEDVVKMRQVALIDGGEEALGDLWAVERVLLAALEAREQFEACQAQIVRLTQSKRVETFERIAGPTALSSFAARIEAKKAFVALLNGDRKPEDVVAGLVGLAERFPVAAPWAVGRIKTSTSAALLIEAVLKAPEVPEDLKKDLRPEAE